MGRADEVLVVSGHNIGTAELENSIISLDFIAESAAIGANDEIKGTGIHIFI